MCHGTNPASQHALTVPGTPWYREKRGNGRGGGRERGRGRDGGRASEREGDLIGLEGTCLGSVSRVF